ncbi:ABC transporter ATP-binding protein [Amylibacter marinus]|uniref:ABC transporter ATP-binding protein n=1 Tax=Amylibacter marinus TaxID=1475483 RepID=A0ABQ5VRP3_9RHOB|nr:ATP-binding cassette domain-containing protein [Amylibacter marinus]GLQ33763.1 ABC transporter ATP-binding protein [Amylibacter marinus]
MGDQNQFFKVKALIPPFVIFSCITNFAVLISPIFMMQVLDRVVPSENMNTLYLLLTLALGIIIANGIVEYLRDISLKRIGIWGENLGAKLALSQADETQQQAIQSVGEFKKFFAGSGATTAVNIPWIPLFLGALALIHVNFLILVGTIVTLSVLIKFLSSWASRDQSLATQTLSQHEMQVLEDAADPQLRAGINAISDNLFLRYFSLQRKRQLQEATTLQISVGETAALSTLRMSSQILALSLGAALVVAGDLSAGGMIAASILSAKTIQTIEGAINSLPDLRSGLAAFKSLSRLDDHTETKHTETNDLHGELSCNGLIYPRGAGAMPRLDRISLTIPQGQCLAIIGDSGSGKTTLLHALCGIDPCPIGSVFMAETEVRTLGAATRRDTIGYLPQQARLIKGTIAENISCFALEPNDDDILQAAKTAGVHGLISALPQAYQTDMASESFLLSSGQKQRVALARAIYARPKFLFLDEPNALLDAHGERQLFDTLALLKKQGTTIVMVVHRSGVMGLADKILLLDQGKMADFGPRAEVLGRLNDGKQKIKVPLNTASLQDLNDWVQTQFNRHSDKEFAQKTILAATEMFNTALQNGPANVKREITFAFKFIQKHSCELTLSEERKTDVVEKLPKIKSLINHPEVSMIDLSDDEISLAVLAQISDRLNIENIKGNSYFTAEVSTNQPQRMVS